MNFTFLKYLKFKMEEEKEVWKQMVYEKIQNGRRKRSLETDGL